MFSMMIPVEGHIEQRGPKITLVPEKIGGLTKSEYAALPVPSQSFMLFMASQKETAFQPISARLSEEGKSLIFQEPPGTIESAGAGQPRRSDGEFKRFGLAPAIHKSVTSEEAPWVGIWYSARHIGAQPQHVDARLASAYERALPALDQFQLMGNNRYLQAGSAEPEGTWHVSGDVLSLSTNSTLWPYTNYSIDKQKGVLIVKNDSGGMTEYARWTAN